MLDIFDNECGSLESWWQNQIKYWGMRTEKGYFYRSLLDCWIAHPD
jgi:hypothetical protein